MENITTSIVNGTVKKSLPAAAIITMGWFALVFLIIGVMGNALTILALAKNRKLREDASSWFIINLAISDTLVCLVMMLNYALRYLLGINLERMVCAEYPVVRYALIHVTVLSMLGVTVNRYVLIVHRGYYDRLYRTRNLIIMTVFIWAIPFLALSPPYFGYWGFSGYDPERDICMIQSKDPSIPSTEGSNPLPYVLNFFFGTACTTIIFCYSVIFYKVRSSRRNLLLHRHMARAEALGSKPPRNWGREELQLTKMIGLILAAYVIGFVPINTVRWVDSVAQASGGKRVPIVIYVTSLMLGWSIFCTNFIIYAVTNKQYRNAYRDLLCCGRTIASKKGWSQPPSAVSTKNEF